MFEDLNVRYEKCCFKVVWNGDNGYNGPNNIFFEYLYEGNEEINGKQFYIINAKFNRDFVKLVYNPISKCYWLCNIIGVPWIMINDIYKPIKCDTLKYIGFPIPKNGCSCLLKSALHYDNHISQEATDSERFIWENPQVFSKVRLGPFAREDFANTYKGYKKFIVVQPENERFVRFLNWSYKSRYNTFYNFDLPIEEVRKEHEWSFPLVTVNPVVSDQHAVPQSTHIEQYIKLFYNNDRTAFENDVEVVQLKDLRQWFGDTFGKPMIMNNIDKPEDWVFKF